MEEWHIIEISLSEFEVNITVFSMLCVYGGNIIVLIQALNWEVNITVYNQLLCLYGGMAYYT